MNPSTKKVLKWTGIILGSILLLAIILGIYIYTIIPKPIGAPVKLQEALFARPAQAFPMEGKYIYKSATELAAMIRHREATAVEVVTEFLNNIRNNNYKYNALIWIRAEEALQDAQRADQMVADGDTMNHPLLGVPVTIKEMYWVKGSPSTLNAKMYGFTAPDDATVVKQLKSAGAVVLGTTNVPFMLMDYQTQGEVYPTASNPYDTSRTPGGSTGGGAAAKASPRRMSGRAKSAASAGFMADGVRTCEEIVASRPQQGAAGAQLPECTWLCMRIASTAQAPIRHAQ